MTQLVSVRDAARLVSKSEQMLRKLVHEGKLSSTMENGRHMLDPNAVVDFYRHSTATRRGAVTKSDPSSTQPNDNGSAIVPLLERQIAMLERELEHSKQQLASEQAARSRLELDMSAVLKEIRASLDGSQSNLLTRFLRK